MNDLENYVILDKKEYEKLIKSKIKAEQYKSYILENSNNNNLVKVMMTIEGKGFGKLLEEKKESEEK